MIYIMKNGALVTHFLDSSFVNRFNNHFVHQMYNGRGIKRAKICGWGIRDSKVRRSIPQLMIITRKGK